MTKRDPGGRKRRLKRINEARRRRKDDDVDVGGISRLETTTTTTTTADHPPTQRDFGGDAMMMMAVDKVVAKHAMKKATKKAKFLESACASRALFSFPKREMERLDVWVPFQLLCSFRLFQLCTRID